jgi:hypothetical protein
VFCLADEDEAFFHRLQNLATFFRHFFVPQFFAIKWDEIGDLKFADEWIEFFEISWKIEEFCYSDRDERPNIDETNVDNVDISAFCICRTEKRYCRTALQICTELFSMEY